MFEEGVYSREKIYVDQYDHIHRNLKSMLCINNHIGVLDDKYDFTIGKLYKLKTFEMYGISFIDDNGKEQYFNPSDVSKNFSPEQSYEDYLIKKSTEKFNI